MIVHKLTIRAAKSPSGKVLFHRVAVPFIGTFAVLPDRLKAVGGADALSVAILGKPWNKPTLSAFLR